MELLIRSSLLVLALCLSSCDNSTMTSSKQHKTNSDVTRAYSGKPAAPVQLEYQILDQPQTGIPLSISLTIIPAVTANSVSMQLKASPGLFITDGSSVLELSNLAAGQAVIRRIEVLPQSDGKHQLYLNVYIDSANGRSGTRSFSISFTTGNIEKETQFPNAFTIQPATDGEKLIIQKGVETRTVEP